MELIIALLCFFGIMSYEDAGVSRQQVEAELRQRNVTVESTFERTTEKQMVIDRSETR